MILKLTQGWVGTEISCTLESCGIDGKCSADTKTGVITCDNDEKPITDVIKSFIYFQSIIYFFLIGSNLKPLEYRSKQI